jgi:7,8-dihydroneopterin aldolase/epimerase/oxygenase
MQNSFNDINLAQCRRFFLKNYEISIYIDVYDHEKKAVQRVIFNIDLYIPLNLNTPIDDALE